MDVSISEPSLFKKLWYLGGIRAAPEHKEWVSGILQDPNSRRRGLLLSLPNAAIVLVAALASLALGDASYSIFLMCLAPAIALAGVFVGSIARRRAGWLARRNGLPEPPN